MANNYGSLVVELSANIARFQGDLGKATSIAQGYAGKLDRIAGGIRTAFLSVGAGLSFGALATGIRSTIDELDEIGKAARRVGLDSGSYAGFEAAFKQAGGAAGELETAITKLNVKIGEASSGQNARFAEELKAIGVDVKQGTEPALIALADRFAGIQSPAERAALGADLFGKAVGTKMADFLAQGSAAVSEQVKRMGELSGITDEATRRAAEFNDRMDDLSQHTHAAGTSLTLNLLPGLTDTAKAMAKLSEEGHPLLALMRGFVGLGKVPWDLIFPPENDTAAKRIADLRVELGSLERAAKTAAGSGLIHKWLYGSKDEIDQKIVVTRNQIALLQKYGDKFNAPAAPTAAAATPEADPDQFTLQAEDMQKSLRKAFNAAPLDDFLRSFKDRRAKIVDEYRKLQADLSGTPAADATAIDISYELSKGRAALSQGDAAGANIAADRLKELFSSFAGKEGTAGFEKSYFSSQMQAFELAIVDASESAAIKAQQGITEKLAALSEDTTQLKVNVDGNAIVDQVKSAIEQIKRDLLANPLQIPIIGVPSISASGATSVDISRAALKYGNRG